MSEAGQGVVNLPLLGTIDGANRVFSHYAGPNSPVLAVYRTDWQGRRKLYATPRTNLITDSGFLTTAGSGAATPASFTGVTGTTKGLHLPAGAASYSYFSLDKIGGDATFSVFLRMDDGGAPVPGNGPYAGYDFIMRVWGGSGSGAALSTLVVTDLGGGLYKCSVKAAAVAVGSLTGVYKYATNSARGLTITGYQLEIDTSGVYIPTETDPVTITDYTLDADNRITLAVAPPKGTLLSGDAMITFGAVPSLLPPNATAWERRMEQVMAHIGTIPVPLRTLWNPDTCPTALLPWLAWQLSIDSWKSYWPEAVKRERVRRALNIQRHKGTVESVRSVVESFGGSVEMREWFQTTPKGTPGTFELWLTLNGQGGTEATAAYVDDVIAEVTRTKPVSRHFTFTQGLSAASAVGVAAYARPAVYRRLTFHADPA